MIKYEHLLGKQFIHGSQDCYDILCKLYQDNLNITLTNYARPDDWWLLEGVDLYRDNFKHEGFVILDDFDIKEVRPFDVFLIALPDMRDRGRTKTNHCAVYIGEGQVVHHRLGKLSQKCNYTGMLRNFTTMTIRHKDVPDLRNLSESTFNLMDHILPHKRQELEKALIDG